MGWWTDSVDKIKEATRSNPVQCPRGWGEVCFVTSGNWMTGGIEKQCPIGGVETCAGCRYPFNPDDTEGLKQRLADLDELLADGVLTRDEYAHRRRLVIEMRDARPTQIGREEGFRIAAWVLGPLGVILAIVGTALALQVHPGFFGIGGAGALLVGLCLSFAALSVPRDRVSAEGDEYRPTTAD